MDFTIRYLSLVAICKMDRNDSNINLNRRYIMLCYAVLFSGDSNEFHLFNVYSQV